MRFGDVELFIFICSGMDMSGLNTFCLSCLVRWRGWRWRGYFTCWVSSLICGSGSRPVTGNAAPVLWAYSVPELQPAQKWLFWLISHQQVWTCFYFVSSCAEDEKVLTRTNPGLFSFQVPVTQIYARLCFLLENDMENTHQTVFHM